MTRPHTDDGVDSDGDRAVCAGCGDPDLWFDPDRVDLASSLCRSCPVRVACLTGAVRRGEEWGVWGGRLFEPSDAPAAPPTVVVAPLRERRLTPARSRQQADLDAVVTQLIVEARVGSSGPEAA